MGGYEPMGKGYGSEWCLAQHLRRRRGELNAAVAQADRGAACLRSGRVFA